MTWSVLLEKDFSCWKFARHCKWANRHDCKCWQINFVHLKLTHVTSICWIQCEIVFCSLQQSNYKVINRKKIYGWIKLVSEIFLTSSVSFTSLLLKVLIDYLPVYLLISFTIKSDYKILKLIRLIAVTLFSAVTGLLWIFWLGYTRMLQYW